MIIEADEFFDLQAFGDGIQELLASVDVLPEPRLICRPSRVTYQALRLGRNHGFGNLVDMLRTLQHWQNEHQGELKGSRASRQVTLPGGFMIGLGSVATVTTTVTDRFQST